MPGKTNSDLFCMAVELIGAARWYTPEEREAKLDELSPRIDALNRSEYAALEYAVTNTFRKFKYWTSPKDYPDEDRVQSMYEYMWDLLQKPDERMN